MDVSYNKQKFQSLKDDVQGNCAVVKTNLEILRTTTKVISTSSNVGMFEDIRQICSSTADSIEECIGEINKIFDNLEEYQNKLDKTFGGLD